MKSVTWNNYNIYKNNKRNEKPITAYLVNTTQRQEQSPTKYKVKPRLPKYGSPSETTRITWLWLRTASGSPAYTTPLLNRKPNNTKPQYEIQQHKPMSHPGLTKYITKTQNTMTKAWQRSLVSWQFLAKYSPQNKNRLMSFRRNVFVSTDFWACNRTHKCLCSRYSTSLKKASFIASLIRTTVFCCANIIAKGFSNDQLAF